jgi:TatD DNase family protein
MAHAAGTFTLSIIDTHCHLTYPDFNRDRDDMLKRAADAGVENFITVATGPDDWLRCLDLAEGRQSVRVALGIHPNEASIYAPALRDEMRRLAQNDERVVAIGETGLDFFRDNTPADKQHEAFQAQLDLACELEKPFILHCRAAEEQMLRVLRDHRERTGRPLRGVWHCFTSTPAFAAQAVELGLYFGLGGVITYPKAVETREAAAALPPDRIVLETDCPFLPPQGWRGQRNEPAYLSKVVETLAQVRAISPEKLCRRTSENARSLFGLAIPG